MFGVQFQKRPVKVLNKVGIDISNLKSIFKLLFSPINFSIIEVDFIYSTIQILLFRV